MLDALAGIDGARCEAVEAHRTFRSRLMESERRMRHKRGAKDFLENDRPFFLLPLPEDGPQGAPSGAGTAGGQGEARP